ncbi:MAG: M20/M25/M40 family metallo-hydrolase [Candidatus Aminicenantes bacterium]|nr:MAG: M20/M25/M40 family metallo-hydrolase [Candidatus Aminicenantes bacterium]
MKTTKFFTGLAILLVLISSACKSQQQKAVESITAEELKLHLDVIASDEFRGRNTPSQELKIASRYIATLAESYGLKPLMPDGSFFQGIPLEVYTIDQVKTRMRLTSKNGAQDFSFPHDFGIRDRSYQDMEISGEILFVGYGLSSAKLDWDDLKGLDLKGKIVVMIDPDLPDGHRLNTPENRSILRYRSYNIGGKGAAAVLSIVSESREKIFEEKGSIFDSSPRGVLAKKLKTLWVRPSQQRYVRAEIRHSVAKEILGITQKELIDMFATIQRGEQIPSKKISGKKIDISLKTLKRKDKTYNVVAWQEGIDEQLKEEYILFGSHHDHIGTREGKIYNGADDNGSGSVAMLELAQAMQIDRPKRSVIFVWHTAEEKGLWGSRYFVEHSPVPVENMSAELNMDMICRNDPGHLYIIGSNKLSSELDAIINAVNDKHIRMTLDYKYEDPKHPDNFFFRSDQYPYIQYGIPAVWFFCGTTEDYHQETDTIDRVDFTKMTKVTRFVYLTAMVIGNKPGMLELDIRPEITQRGEHNLKIQWR